MKWKKESIDKVSVILGTVIHEIIEVYSKEVSTGLDMDAEDIGVISNIFELKALCLSNQIGENEYYTQMFKLHYNIKESTSDIKGEIYESKQKIIHNIINLTPPPTEKIIINGGVMASEISGNCTITGIYNNHMIMNDMDTNEEKKMILWSCSIEDLIYLGEIIEAGDYEVGQYTKGE